MAKTETKPAAAKAETPEAEQSAPIVVVLKLLGKTERNEKGELKSDKPKEYATLVRPYPCVVGPGAVFTEDGLNQSLVRVSRNDEKGRTESHIKPLRFDKAADANAEAKRLKSLGWKAE